MRAGRLFELLQLLEARERMTATELATELEVSTRTILRDIDELSGAGVPVYAERGAKGGFSLLRSDPSGAAPRLPRSSGRITRVGVLVSPHGRQLLALFGTPGGFRTRKVAEPPTGRPDWVEGSVRIESIEAGVLDLLRLGPDVEVLRPTAVRDAVATAVRHTANLYE